MEKRSEKSTWNTATDERRQATRFVKDSGSDSAVVWQHPGQELLVDVHDESLHGICLVMTDVAAYQVGTAATIVYHSDVLDATVRRVSPQPDGTFLVGFECRQ